jgi:nitrogen fixation protein FixH
MAEIKGHHVLACFVLGFGIIIAVNLTLAVNAVRTFPGLEVKNSYVASQSFDNDRSAQQALGWRVSSWLDGDILHLQVLADGQPIAPRIDRAVFGRATSVIADQNPVFAFDGRTLSAPVSAGPGNWNLRLAATAGDGTAFRQRIVVRPKP